MRVSWDNENAIWVAWVGEDEPPYYLCEDEECFLPKQIVKPVTSVRGVNFIPNRDDIVLLSADKGVYALEIDGRGGRMMYPVYEGVEPNFAVFENNDKVYVIDLIGTSISKTSFTTLSNPLSRIAFSK